MNEEYDRPISFIEVGIASVRKAIESLPGDHPKVLRKRLGEALAGLNAVLQTIERGFIRCPKCDLVSYNPNDVRFKFCGNCDQYHDGTKRELGDHADELWKPGEAP